MAMGLIFGGMARDTRGNGEMTPGFPGSDSTPELSQLNQDFYPRYKLCRTLPRNCHNLTRILPQVQSGSTSTPELSQLNLIFRHGQGSQSEVCGDVYEGKSLLIYICNFHVISNLLLIYICKLHWNLNTMFLCQVNNF